MLSHTQYSVSMTTVCVNTICMYRNESHYRVKPKTSSHSRPILPVTLENSYIGAGQATRGGGVLVTIDEDLAVNDKN